MLKKIISISFLILIFAFSFQLLINYLKVEHEVEYIIENNYHLDIKSLHNTYMNKISIIINNVRKYQVITFIKYYFKI